MSNSKSSTIEKLVFAGELAMSLLKRVKLGEISAEEALSDAEAQWKEAADEANDLRKLGHEQE